MHEPESFHILRTDCSVQRDPSIRWKPGDEVLRRRTQGYPAAMLMVRDLADPTDFTDADWAEVSP
jgi:hypothetical protein